MKCPGCNAQLRQEWTNFYEVTTGKYHTHQSWFDSIRAKPSKRAAHKCRYRRAYRRHGDELWLRTLPYLKTNGDAPLTALIGSLPPPDLFHGEHRFRWFEANERSEDHRLGDDWS